MTKRPKSDYAIQTVHNATRLLESFDTADELGVAELGRLLGLHKNNVFRLLATLEGAGFVEQCTDSERYRLGVRAFQLGQAFARSRNLARLARTMLETLAEELNETAHFAVLRDYEVVHLDGEPPRRMMLTGVRIGWQLPAHCTALGKVLLACGGPEVPARFDCDVVAKEPLSARTPATLTDRVKFFEHLRGVASQGFATDLEECEEGVCCAAAPVYDGGGRLLAALSVSGPSVRLDEERLLREVAPKLRAAGESVSRQLGYAG